MNTRGTRLLAVVGLILLAVPWAMATGPFDGRSETWRGLFFTMNVHNLAMGPVAGTEVGVREVAGLVFYDDGEVATMDAWLSFFLDEERSHYEGFALIRFRDGSTQTASLRGCRSATGAETGEFSFVCGSGRYQGITGTGVFTRNGFSLADGSFVHAKSTYRLLTD